MIFIQIYCCVTTSMMPRVVMRSVGMTGSGMKLTYETDGVDNCFISGDRHRMKQVFLNIIDNAAKYGREGKKIAVAIARIESEILVSVRDWGPGIPEDELPHVKERFYKGSSKERGSGIGLAVTDEIVKLHGGRLDITSKVGEGTMVTVAIPALEPVRIEMPTVELPPEEEKTEIHTQPVDELP